MARFIILPFVLLINLSYPLYAQMSKEKFLKISRINGEVILDGIPNEKFWDKIDPLPLTMFSPYYKGEPTEKTIIKFAYDSEYFYAAGWLYDSEPNKIQANALERDVDRGGDFFNILIDSYNDNENLTTFSTTPSGNKLDGIIPNDAETTDFLSFNFNNYWDVEVSKNETGWFAEMRVPFSSLKFQDDNGRVVMGLITHRLIARKNERHVFPDISPAISFAAWKASQAQKIVFEGIHSSNPVYVSPYYLADFKHKNEKTEVGVSNEKLIQGNFGADVKYNITNSLTLDLSYNTDFAQAEVDDQQINTTRFSLYFPEKRQFFQERAGVFDFSIGSVSTLFYSRRIGFSPELKPVGIYGGARIVGRISDFDIGIISMQTKPEHDLNSENYSVVRVRKSIFNNASYVGTMITSKLDGDGGYNINYAFDATLRLSKDDNFSTKFIHTLDSDISKVGKNFGKSIYTDLSYDRFNINGFAFGGKLARSPQLFNPEMGISLRKDFVQLTGYSSFGFLQNENSPILRFTPKLTLNQFYRDSDGQLETERYDFEFKSTWQNGGNASVRVRYETENIDEPFSIGSSVNFSAGKYKYSYYKLAYNMPSGELLRFSGSVTYGNYYDGKITNVQLDGFWNQSKHLEISAGYGFNKVFVSERNELFEAHIGKLRFLYSFDTHLSANFFIQYISNSDIVLTNARLRYNIKDGADIFLVYNQEFNPLNGDSDITLLRFNNRSILLKFVYTLIY